MVRCGADTIYVRSIFLLALFDSVSAQFVIFINVRVSIRTPVFPTDLTEVIRQRPRVHDVALLLWSDHFPQFALTSFHANLFHDYKDVSCPQKLPVGTSLVGVHSKAWNPSCDSSCST